MRITSAVLPFHTPFTARVRLFRQICSTAYLTKYFRSTQALVLLDALVHVHRKDFDPLEEEFTRERKN